MFKKILLRMAAFGLLFAAGAAGVSAQTPVTLDAAIRQVAAGIEERLEANTKVVILDFNPVIKTTSKRLSDHVVDELSACFINNGKLDVLERNNLALIDEEMTFQASGEVSDDSAQSFGQKLGAQSIISGFMEDLGEYYRIRFRTLNVETARVQGLQSANVRKDDPQIKRLIQGERFMDTKHFTFGAGAGLGPGLYSLGDITEDYEDTAMVSTFNLQASIYGAFNISPLFALQLELNVLNNGFIIDAVDMYIYEIEGVFDDDFSRYFPTREEAQIKDWFTYMSLDIPLLARFNFRPVPVVLISVLAGPYVSLPISELKNEYHYPNFSQQNDTDTIKILNVQYGVLAGLTAGLSVGPGYITARARFMNDLVPIVADYWGDKELDLFTRRVVGFSLGYELWF